MGKGRTIAGLILENWRCERKRHLWLTIGTDLRIDSRRDLDDVGATDIPLHPLNKLPYGQLDSEKVPPHCPHNDPTMSDELISLLPLSAAIQSRLTTLTMAL